MNFSRLDTNYRVDVTPVTNLLQQKDFAAIINDPALFRGLFYKTISDANLNGYVTLRRERNLVVATGHQEDKAKLDEHIELIRKCFDRAHGLKQNFTVNAVHASSLDITLEPVLREEYVYEEFYSPGTTRISISLYTNLIKPALQRVAESLAASCILTKDQRGVELKGVIPNSIKDIDVFSIIWSDREHFVYPVPPTLPQEHPNLTSSLYKLYRDQQHCDLTIEDKDRNRIKVHSLPFLVCKSAKLQTLLSKALARKDKRLVIDNFGMEAIKKFIDFIYLGPKALDPNDWQSKEITTSGLLSLAHFLELPAFMDCCTNLLSLTASKADAAHINRLAKLYDNDHLRALAAYLGGHEETVSTSKRSKVSDGE